MEIKDFSEYSFLVVLPRGEDEDRDAYLLRCLDCLEKFYGKHSMYKNGYYSRWTKWAEEAKNGLETLLGEHNFCDMLLDGIGFCNVKHRVFLEEAVDSPSGILVHSHQIKDLKPSVEFLRGLWTKMHYEQPAVTSQRS